MNLELQAILDICFDVVELGEDAVHKKYFQIMGDVVRILKDLPSAADHFADLQNEISQLQNSANQAALIKYIEQKFQSSAPDSPKALAIAMSGLALAQQALNFYQSIVSLKSIIQS